MWGRKARDHFRGPPSYAQGGTHPTVTDAALTLGYIDPNYFLGGRMNLDIGAAKTALGRDVAAPLGLDLRAGGVGRVARYHGKYGRRNRRDHHQPGHRSTRGSTHWRGRRGGAERHTPSREGWAAWRSSSLMSGPHSAPSARISPNSVPISPRLFVTSCGRFDYEEINRVLADLKGKCQAFIEGPGKQSLEQRLGFTVEARYAHQIWEIEVPLRTDRFTSETQVEQLKEDFHSNHREIFAIEDRESEVELIAWRARVHCALRKGDIGSLVARIPTVAPSSSLGRPSSKMSGSSTRASTTSRTWTPTESSRGQPSLNRPSQHWSSTPGRQRAAARRAHSSSTIPGRAKAANRYPAEAGGPRSWT